MDKMKKKNSLPRTKWKISWKKKLLFTSMKPVRKCTKNLKKSLRILVFVFDVFKLEKENLKLRTEIDAKYFELEKKKK